MKKLYSYLLPVTIFAFIFSAGLSAQETTVSVKVEKDGKLVKDTTYSFKDADQAQHALMMMDMMGSDDEMSGDSLVWISEGEHQHDGDVKVIKYKIDSDDTEGTRVVVVKSGDGETFDILIDEDVNDEDGNIVKTKEVKVIVSTDEEKVVKKKSKKQ